MMMMMMMFLFLTCVCVIMTDLLKERQKGRIILFFFVRCSSKACGLISLHRLLKFGLHECVFRTLEYQRMH